MNTTGRSCPEKEHNQSSGVLETLGPRHASRHAPTADRRLLPGWRSADASASRRHHSQPHRGRPPRGLRHPPPARARPPYPVPTPWQRLDRPAQPHPPHAAPPPQVPGPRRRRRGHLPQRIRVDHLRPARHHDSLTIDLDARPRRPYDGPCLSRHLTPSPRARLPGRRRPRARSCRRPHQAPPQMVPSLDLVGDRS